MNDKNQSQEQTQNSSEKKVWYKKWWVVALGIIFLYSIGNSAINNASKTGSNSQPQNNQPTENKESATKTAEKKTEPEKTIPQVVVTSVNISKEYSENEVAADEKYKGKIIEISGKVASIDNGTFDNEMIVRLSDGQYDMNTAACYMKESEKEKVLTFKKGQQITLIGTGDSATLKSPVLKNCTVK